MVSVSTCAMYLASAVVSLSKQMKITGFRAQWCCGCTKKKQQKKRFRWKQRESYSTSGSRRWAHLWWSCKKKYRNHQIDEELLKYPHVLLRLAEADTWIHREGLGEGGAGIQADHKCSLLKEKGCMSAVTSGAGRQAAAALWFVLSSLCFLLNKNQRKKNDNVKYVSLYSKFGMAQL